MSALPPSSIMLPRASVLDTYFSFVAFFHISEFFMTAMHHPNKTPQFPAFCLSKDYAITLALGVLEFLVKDFLYPEWTGHPFFVGLGMVVMMVGETIRKLAMMTAGQSFTHEVATRRKEYHHLMKSGIYSIARHPGYMGWFMWAIGTQILLANPICLVIYSVIAWRFFDERIYFEEYMLLQFYGREYAEYQRQVPTGIPFIDGCYPRLMTLTINPTLTPQPWNAANASPNHQLLSSLAAINPMDMDK